MSNRDELADVPEWGRPFAEDVYSHILQLSGQAYDRNFSKDTMQSTFVLAAEQLEGLSTEKRKEKLTKEWLLELAAETFVRRLIRCLTFEVDTYYDLLCHAYHQKLRHRLASLLKKAEDDPDVDECLQETLIKIYRSLLSKAERGQQLEYPLIGWLYSVAKSICLEYWKKHKHKSATLSLEQDAGVLETMGMYEQSDLGVYIEVKEREEKIRACIEQLPEPCRTSVRLFYFDNLPLATIAERQNLPLGAIRTCIYQKAKRRLRKLWREESGD